MPTHSKTADWPTLCSLALACALTLTLRGYQFGHSNHTVYLIDALRFNDPRLLANDWFATHTLQYHVVFTRLTAALDRAGLLRAAFLAGYLALIALLHLGWLLITRALGGTWRTYLLSVLLFFLSAGGVGLGMYEFLQDSAFLPSNVANVAMLWGMYFLIAKRPAAAGAALGLAGFFHLNHALVAIALWTAMLLWSIRFDGAPPSETAERAPSGRPLKGVVAGTIFLLALSIPNILPAARAALSARGAIPLSEFVDLYVRLRHPHHYDPSTWPMALWISFLWPFPLAILAFARGTQTPALRQARRVFLLLGLLQVIALTFAGVWYVSEPLVQMSLYRFSIYPKLLSCIGAAMLLLGRDRERPVVSYIALPIVAAAFAARFIFAEHLPAFVADNVTTLLFVMLLLISCATLELVDGLRRPIAIALFAIPVLATAAAFVESRIANRHLLGLRLPMAAADPADYLRLCAYARDHTPIDAIFLVPPSEQEFRLAARRAIVVNFKGVPQLGSELPEWRDRLSRVLKLPRLASLPRGRFDHTLAAIADRYDHLSADHLLAVARQYHARYVVTAGPLQFPGAATLVFESGHWRLYDLGN